MVLADALDACKHKGWIVMCQAIAPNWFVFSLTLADLLLFGIFYALLVRYMWVRKVEGQTAYMVVFGVGFALTASIFTFGLPVVGILFAYFGACGLPMVIEYAHRVHLERRRDVDAAASLAKEAMDAKQTADR